MRLLNWEWGHVSSRFSRFSAGQINPFDESLSYAGANAYNEGLRAGYVHASFLDRKTQSAFLTKLRSLSPLVKAGQWNRLDQISYVAAQAGAGLSNGLFVSDASCKWRPPCSHRDHSTSPRRSRTAFRSLRGWPCCWPRWAHDGPAGVASPKPGRAAPEPQSLSSSLCLPGQGERQAVQGDLG